MWPFAIPSRRNISPTPFLLVSFEYILRTWNFITSAILVNLLMTDNLKAPARNFQHFLECIWREEKGIRASAWNAVSRLRHIHQQYYDYVIGKIRIIVAKTRSYNRTGWWAPIQWTPFRCTSLLSIAKILKYFAGINFTNDFSNEKPLRSCWPTYGNTWVPGGMHRIIPTFTNRLFVELS